MAPIEITDDYYLILEVKQTATLEVITKSYRRLALVLHPDRNPRSNATEAFQLVSEESSGTEIDTRIHSTLDLKQFGARTLT